jgi:class 3 adenylate cyclase
MAAVSPLVPDPVASRFCAGGLAEAEALLGSPLPILPPIERDDGREVFFVHVQERLRGLLQRYVQILLAQIGVPLASSRGDTVRDQAEYETAIARIARALRSSDRRFGLYNLFWLAHTRAIAENLRDLEAKNPSVRKAKYSLHPLLSSFFRRVDQESRKETEDDQAKLWGQGNPGLVEALIEDGFAITEPSVAEFEFKQFLAANKRYRISAELFAEIQAILVRDIERRLREGDRGLMARAARHLPGLPKDQQLKPASLVKLSMNHHVLTYVMGDPWGAGSRLLASPALRAEVERRKPAEIIDGFLDVVRGAKRFEIVSQARDRICYLQESGGGSAVEDKAGRGYRVYEFGESAQVINNAVNATVLFLDLRGFTKTSEGQISERDLTRELYLVFDAFVPIIRRFGGTVDKYLGDGIMVTFGTGHADTLDPLNAVRTAVLCQETLERLRERGKTYFKMGIAVHYGRVYLARFIVDGDSVQRTVIGRNVNLAGRLSSAAKKPLEEDEEGEPEPEIPARAFGLRVSVESGGMLSNEGIAISRDTLVQLEHNLPMVTGERGEGVIEYEDEVIGRRILIRYAGDAKFKGVRSSFPVYEVDFVPLDKAG